MKAKSKMVLGHFYSHVILIHKVLQELQITQDEQVKEKHRITRQVNLLQCQGTKSDKVWDSKVIKEEKSSSLTTKKDSSAEN